VTSFPYRTSATRPPEAIVPLPDEATRLGALRKTYAPASLPKLLRFPALMALVMMVVSASLAGKDAFRSPDLFITLSMAPLALAMFALAAWRPLRRRNLRIDVHEGGLVSRGFGPRSVVIFDDVSEVWFDLEFLMYGQARTTGLRLMELSGGTFYVAGQVEDAVGLFNAVLRRCSEPLISEARAALREGDVLTFGKVKIDRDEIVIGNARAAWSELQLVRLQPGKALFLRGSSLFAWRTVKHDEIPHPTVFLRLVSELAPKVENDESVTKLLR
jgi:hypothetical protein